MTARQVTGASAGDTRSGPPAALPAPRGPLIGRARERAALPDLVLRHAGRLVTLTGVGGGGKTRLALQVASDLAGSFPDGVHLVELAPVAEPALVPQAVAAALGVQEAPGRPLVEALAATLRPRAALLVLDNCEHLVDACAALAERLLGACPDLRLLATSREPLQIPGERRWRVQPLAVPDTDAPLSLAELADCPAVQLFLDRAQGVDPDFALTERNAPAVAQVCIRLDGIPLALELAAARVHVLTVAQILERLDDSLRLLTGGGRATPTRQQTLRVALDWSYDPLPEPEKAVLRRLTVFAGSCDLEAAEATCAEFDVLDVLARLVDKSLLITIDVDGTARYHLLEPVRQYGEQHLRACGEFEVTHLRHAALYTDLAERAMPELRGPEQVAWLRRLDREHDNLRAALRWSVEHGEPDAALRLAVALAPYWEVRGTMSEGRRWLEPILASEHPRPIATAVRSRALLAAGRLAFFQADLARATRFFAESLSLGHSAADEQVVASSLTWLGFVLNRQGDFAQAVQRLEESLVLHRALGNGHDAAWAIHGLGAVASNQEDYARATAFFEESLRSFQALGDLRFSAIASLEFGYAALAVAGGDPERAGHLLRDGLRGLLAIGDRAFMIAGLLTLAIAEARLDRPAWAARLLGALGALRDAHGVSISPVQREAEARLLGLLRPRLGETVLAAALAEGRMLTVEQAIAEILSQGDEGGGMTDDAATPATSSSLRPHPSSLPDGLTPREREVARLVAQGFTDRQIAEALVIAPSTVGTHVHHLLAKLGVKSRWQAGEWAIAHGLVETRPD